MKVVVATRNPGKVAEFRRLLPDAGWEFVGLDDIACEGDIEETETTYAGNASAKAQAVCKATGHAAVGDDSGIEVLALGGWPGIESARWLGGDADDAQRLAELLARVDKETPDDRRARYVAALALARPGRETVVAQGVCYGVLVTPQGTGGFGYDPAFWSLDLGTTFGLAAAADKDRVSHRARAVRALVASVGDV